MQGQLPHTLAERIVCDENILTGKPVIKGTRLAVEFIVGLLGHGWTEAEILENYPHIVQAAFPLPVFTIKQLFPPLVSLDFW